jgi:Cof subfamily protein (haloacid dehalogenase superfamily)
VTTAYDIKLLLSDVDGTLVTKDKVLTEGAKSAAAGLRQAGIGLTLTSARPPLGMRMLVEPLDLRLPLAGFNGGLIVDPEFKVLESHPIDPKAAQEAVRLLRDSGLDLWVYTETAWFVTAQDGSHVAREAWIIKMQPEAVSIADADLARAFKIVGVSDDYAKVAAAESVVQEKLGDTASATRSAPHFLDITHPEATKGFVVRRLSRRLGLPPSQIATIGDMPNDVLMFAESGFSIAMGNASDAVKARASAVTDTNEADGFAEAVRRFLLQPDAASPLESRSAP